MSMSETRQASRPRLLAGRARRAPSARRIALRRLMVLAAKLLLPVLAVLLLASIAAWPEIAKMTEQGRVAFRRAFSVDPDSGRMREPRYHGVDQRGRPYTLTATWASQTGPNRIELGDPKGDMVLESGNWLQVEARNGVFIQHSELLDLSKDVVFYRDDGTVMRTQTAAVDIKQGAAASNDKTHAEGPFGVLDAQGFTLLDKGNAIQFQGPARLILNGSSK
ncbi:MAG: LPS export ABC transporter periplasmic protein LptC [Acetobacteraceae bacterium]|nr:LPS export ABC transporter periplasmic protein LptC [Acetobacteraceae bacterium]